MIKEQGNLWGVGGQAENINGGIRKTLAGVGGQPVRGTTRHHSEASQLHAGHRLLGFIHGLGQQVWADHWLCAGLHSRLRRCGHEQARDCFWVSYSFPDLTFRCAE